MPRHFDLSTVYPETNLPSYREMLQKLTLPLYFDAAQEREAGYALESEGCNAPFDRLTTICGAAHKSVRKAVSLVVGALAFGPITFHTDDLIQKWEGLVPNDVRSDFLALAWLISKSDKMSDTQLREHGMIPSAVRKALRFSKSLHGSNLADLEELTEKEHLLEKFHYAIFFGFIEKCYSRTNRGAYDNGGYSSLWPVKGSRLNLRSEVAFGVELRVERPEKRTLGFLLGAPITPQQVLAWGAGLYEKGRSEHQYDQDGDIVRSYYELQACNGAFHCAATGQPSEEELREHLQKNLRNGTINRIPGPHTTRLATVSGPEPIRFQVQNNAGIAEQLIRHGVPFSEVESALTAHYLTSVGDNLRFRELTRNQIAWSAGMERLQKLVDERPTEILFAGEPLSIYWEKGKPSAHIHTDSFLMGNPEGGVVKAGREEVTFHLFWGEGRNLKPGTYKELRAQLDLQASGLKPRTVPSSPSPFNWDGGVVMVVPAKLPNNQQVFYALNHVESTKYEWILCATPSYALKIHAPAAQKFARQLKDIKNRSSNLTTA